MIHFHSRNFLVEFNIKLSLIFDVDKHINKYKKQHHIRKQEPNKKPLNALVLIQHQR